MRTRIEHDSIGEIGVLEHNGREYKARGATVTDQYAVAYPGAGGILKDWSGNPVGTWKAVASWPIRSYMGSRMYQIQAWINGRCYTGRGLGEGMIWRGKVRAVREVKP